MIPFGFEPKTYCLEGSCSIQLSYGTKNNKKGDDFSSPKSGWQDSNLRPPAPKAGAIPGYATPRGVFLSFLFCQSNALNWIRTYDLSDSGSHRIRNAILGSVLNKWSMSPKCFLSFLFSQSNALNWIQL